MAELLGELNRRSRDVFRQIVEAYLHTGTPVGSRTLAQRGELNLSPASIRNVMQDLETAGLLYAPHTSAGRLPTERGLRLFIDGLLEIGELTEQERASIEGTCQQSGRSFEEMLNQASDMLSGLSHCAGLVSVPKMDAPLKHVEFVDLGAGRMLVILVSEAGMVENRMVELPAGVLPSMLIQAANYVNGRYAGRSLSEVQRQLGQQIDQMRRELDELTAKVVETGLATVGGGDDRTTLIVRGRANLLDDVSAGQDLERIRRLFDDLESTEEVRKLLQATSDADGVHIFIGSENQLFSMSGSSLIVAPYSNGQQQVVGAIGVIGPTHLNYARIIPMVDYTAKVIGRLLT
ncbi:MAG: heat-inducible transcriptional repressor HrcA [Alphaproteobacteria bacterium]